MSRDISRRINRSDQNAAEAATGTASAVVSQSPPVVTKVMTAQIAVVNAVSPTIWRSLIVCMRGMLPSRPRCVRGADGRARSGNRFILSAGLVNPAPPQPNGIAVLRDRPWPSDLLSASASRC